MTGIQRLRELADDMFAHDLWDSIREGIEDKYGVTMWDDKTVNGLLRDIADQIEDEQEERVTRRLEDREAAEWVRAHGGLDAVKKEWSLRGNFKRQLEKAQEKVERQQRHIELVQGKCHERLVRIAALNKTVAEMRPRLMPEGMEWLIEAWPRFEDGRPARFSDDFERDGDEHNVGSVTMYRNGNFALNFLAYSKGERVNRPAPKVYDADGADTSVGDTVYEVEGTGHAYRVVNIRVGDGNPLTPTVVTCDVGDGTSEHFLPSQLTHTKPEPPDSFSLIEQDAELTPYDYAMKHGKPDGVSNGKFQRVDLVRRAKALAEVECDA